jgi:hypothetical protein
LIKAVIRPLNEGIELTVEPIEIAFQPKLISPNLRHVGFELPDIYLQPLHLLAKKIEVEIFFSHGEAYHKSSTSRAGSSRASFTRTRKVTASRPSTMRWS